MSAKKTVTKLAGAAAAVAGTVAFLRQVRSQGLDATLSRLGGIGEELVDRASKGIDGAADKTRTLFERLRDSAQDFLDDADRRSAAEVLPQLEERLAILAASRQKLVAQRRRASKRTTGNHAVEIASINAEIARLDLKIATTAELRDRLQQLKSTPT